MDRYDAIAAHLAGLAAPGGPFLAAGLARIGRDGSEAARAIGHAAPGGPPFHDPTMRLRFASVSKAATARAVVACAPDLGADLRDLLDWDRPPGLTLDRLLSHTAGLADHAGYVVDPPASVTAFVDAHPACRPGPPGFFRYANLGYVLLGMALERLAGRRFDAVLRETVLDPAGIGGGYNWAGVAERRPLALWQRRGDRLDLEADGPDADWAAPLLWRGGRGVPLDGYRIGRDSTWFSPHAGLRMSVIEAARLARLLASDDAVGRAQRAARWRFDGTNGEDCGGLFTAFGAGVALYDGHPRIPGPLVGHAGHALGFTGGAWANVATGEAWAYFLTGSADLTEGSDEEAFYAADEAWIMERL